MGHRVLVPLRLRDRLIALHKCPARVSWSDLALFGNAPHLPSWLLPAISDIVTDSGSDKLLQKMVAAS